MKGMSELDKSFKEKIQKDLLSTRSVSIKLEKELAIDRFYRNIKGLDEEAAQVVKSLKFVSVRGRTAWSICCLENALEKFAIYNDAWELLLTKMWEHTQLPKDDDSFLEEWAMFLYYLAPGGRPDNEYNSFVNELQIIKKYSNNKACYIPTQKEYDTIHQAFKNTNSCLIKLCKGVYNTGTERLWGWSPDIGSQNSYATIEIVKVMRQNGISLPSVEPFVGYEYIEDYDDEFALGPAFDGTQYSKFINKK